MIVQRTMNAQRRQVCRQGMTLVELMISLLIFGIIMAVVFGFLTESRSSYQETRAKAQYQQSMRAVISLLSREIRSTGCDPTEAGFERFAQADIGALRCRMDLNGDGDAIDNGPDEDITYTFNAGTGELSRNAGGGNMVILRDLQNVTFTYLDNNGNPLNNVPLNALDRSSIRSVIVALQGETAEGVPLNYATRVVLRND